jgi:predicted site-specific integrase-resolvase
MTEVHRNAGRRTMKVPEFLREPIEQAQAKLMHMEENAQKALKDLIIRGREGRKELEAMVARLSIDDRVSELKDRLEKFRETGIERAGEWRDRAEVLRAEALERMVELQGKAVAFLGVATREQVEELHRELDRLARKLERQGRGRKARRTTHKAEA